ncbi:Fc.00g034870.m01.CDS01 [Cosmosporella sp. VM-42]
MPRQACKNISVMESSADHQSQCCLFRLPPEIRRMIYHLAFPRLRMPQHVYISHTDELCQVEVTDGLPLGTPMWKHADSMVRAPCCPMDGAIGEPAGQPRFRPARYRALKTTFEPLSLRYQRGTLHSVGLYTRMPLPKSCLRRDSTHISSEAKSELKGPGMTISRCHRFQWPKPNDEQLESIRPPTDLLLSCRRLYQDVAPLCDGTLTFADLRTLEVFLGFFGPDLVSRVKNIYLLLSLTPFHNLQNDREEEKRRKKVISKWESVLGQLAKMSIKSLKVKLAMESQCPRFTAYWLRQRKERGTKAERLEVMKDTAKTLLDGLRQVAGSIPEISIELDRGMALDDALLLRPLRGDECDEMKGSVKCQICNKHEEWSFDGWRVVQGEGMSWPCLAFCWGHL